MNDFKLTVARPVFEVSGGLSELPMWLKDGFLLTYIGRWREAMHIHMKLPYIVLMCRVVWALMCGSHVEMCGNYPCVEGGVNTWDLYVEEH